jgi:Tat protein secretion system quality control protein TatD with DNase activity
MEIIQLIPLNRLLVESDAPYQNSYKDIPLLINKLSEIKNTTPTTLTDQIKNNFEEYTNDR